MEYLSLIAVVFVALRSHEGCVRAQFKDDLSCSDDVIEACDTDFIVFAKGPQLADTPEKLAESCKRELKSAECTKDYTTRCLVGFTRGAALVAINAVVEELEAKCDTTHAANKRYFKHVKCMNMAGEKAHGCMKRLQEDLYRAAHGAPRKLKIAYACCQYYDFYKCGEEALAEHCQDPDAIKLMEETTDNVFGNMLSIICGAYQRDSTQCRSLDALPQYNNFTVVKNFILPLKAIVRSLG
ncbi:uncharacterized protein LOC142787035 [Rhipicephalus microplus]|uniref:uncharacterized protein LOC142787035 n=1 Tax=Rhipicephalus microplus TaxID=6941 RepID=UPI003F6C7AEB